MQKIVGRSSLEQAISEILGESQRAADTETTGLKAHLRDRLFSIIIATRSHVYYFNFKPYAGLDPDWVLPDPKVLQPIFNDGALIFMHNAKFDIAMLDNEGIEVTNPVHCTEVTARLINNTEFTYTLDACAARDLGKKKDDKVKLYIKKHGIYRYELDPETGEEEQIPDYTKVPFDIMAPYGMVDGQITLDLGIWQLSRLLEIQKNIPSQYRPITNIYENDLRLIKTAYAMERRGAKVDRDYARRGYERSIQAYESAAERFQQISGFPLKDSPKSLQKAFDSVGESYGTTAKGGPSFTDEILEGMTSPLASTLQEYRSSYKEANTYYKNFLHFADANDRIHATMRLGGTKTGRMSYADPNLQNLPKNEEEDQSNPWLVRRCFIPTDSDYCLVMIDYDQMEYRLMLEYADEVAVINKVLGGLDVHQATADMVGITRKQAKTLNFCILFGGGAGKIARMLGITVEQAKILKHQYFSALPQIQKFIYQVMNTARRTGRVINWAGFVNYCRDPDFAYQLVNHLIQGGCAQIVKFVMPKCHDVLRGTKSHLLLQVHDELVFEMHKSELHLVSELKKVMESVYPHRKLPLTCGVSYSWKSWADKRKGEPQGVDDGQTHQELRVSAS